MQICCSILVKKPPTWDFPGGPMVKNLPYNAGDTGSIPGQGTKIPHAMGQLSPHTPQLLSSHASTREPACCKLQSPHALEPAHHNYRAQAPWSPCTTAREKPVHSKEEPALCNKRYSMPQQRSREPQLRPNAAKNK